MARRTDRQESPSDDRTVLVLLALLAVPWSIQRYADGGTTLLFAWGLLNTAPFGVTTLSDFLFVYTRGLPEYIFSWPLSVACYAGAVASAVVGWRRGREDSRVTGGLLAVAGVAQLSLAQGFSVQPGRTAWPLGTLALWAVAWWAYWPRAKRRRT
ncbi:TIGR04206 family protein [Halopelagius longus]|uniref:TIGR04206 family protein n=1 Tax=Halopelagius longus TaxID=1236180 RepID=A0A1H1C4S6_9EURY|nr:TIGR04206 family protein [Halopelagius longus]RDI71063.1 TIGR04206 family protein [Halopelagius longus]SDQ59050.1 TIGR04206 family protein [Halopelagius longus]